MEFDWDEHNLYHIAMHGIAREDAEASLLKPVFVRDEFRNGEDRRSYVGQDLSGRILFLVTTKRGQALRVVTAFRAGRALCDFFLSRRGGR